MKGRDRRRCRPGAGLRRRLFLLSALGAPLAAGAVLGRYIWVQTARAVHPAPADDQATLRRYPFAAATEEVCFTSTDGVSLAGWFIPAPEAHGPTIVLLPGYNQGRAGLLPHAGYLHDAGCHVLIVDFRGTGRSGGAAFTFGMKEARDVQGAVSYLLSRPDVDPAQIGLLGLSYGAAIGLLAMAEDRRIRAMAAESAFASLTGMIQLNFRRYSRLPRFPFAYLIVFVMEHRLGGSVAAVNPRQAVAAIGGRPLLFIDDMLDRLIPPGSAQRLYDAALGPRELWVVPDAGHAGGMWVQPREYAQRVRRFFAAHLAADSAAGVGEQAS